jgi:tRNA-splicing endonuclease subunit Sen54
MSDAIAPPPRDLEDPTAAPVRSTDNVGDSKGKPANDGSDSEDDAAPDYSALAALANRMQGGRNAIADQSSGESSGKSGTPFIPKRGEKDFEPTGFAAQHKALEASRKAMFDVISCERYISNKTISVAAWEPALNRAVVYLARGQTFASMGYANRVHVLEDGQFSDLAEAYNKKATELAKVDGTMKDGVWWPKIQSRLELYPEEALYLVERGSMECRVFCAGPKNERRPRTSANESLQDFEDDVENGSWVPMSVEQTFSTLMHKDGLTRERYQLYAHLKRLGYIVQRKTLADSLRAETTSQRRARSNRDDANEEKQYGTQGIIADPSRPLRLVTIFDILLYPWRRGAQVASTGVERLAALFSFLWNRICQILPSTALLLRFRKESKLVQPTYASRGLLGIGALNARTFDAAFDRLRIVPNGHDDALPWHNRSTTEPDLEIFYYAWRPATHFKKTDPPLPEFQCATVDVRRTNLPSIYAFAHLFSQLPKVISAGDMDDLSEEEQSALRRAQEEKKRNDESYGRGAVRKMKATKAAEASGKKPSDAKRSPLHGRSWMSTSSLLLAINRFVRMLTFLGQFFAHLPPGCADKAFGAARGRLDGKFSGKRPVNVYVPLKVGRRNVIVAVNDCGTTSLLRFGESEFARWRLAGTHHA